MKTYHLSIKQITQQRGIKRYKMEGPKSWQTNNIPKRANHKGNEKNQVLEPSPPIAGSILNKEMGGTPKRMSSLDKPSPIIITQLKIKVVYARYNATDTLYM